MSKDKAKSKQTEAGQERVTLTPKDIQAIWKEVYREIQKVMIGKITVVEDLMIALLGEGHILLEGVPGIAKTHLSNAFATAIGCTFKRAQFTPDLLPSDILGTNIYDPKSGTFKMRRGPIFTNILLADEINRSPPKTQAALLEAMAEKQVSIEGTTYKLDPPFMVIATQNPVEQEGTYPLPEAQMDRFMFKLILDLPSPEEELGIIKLKHEGVYRRVEKKVDPITVVKMQQVVRDSIHITEEVMSYIRDIVVRTRTDARVLLGGSPRASIALLNASKAWAAMNGRSYVIPDDVKRVLKWGIGHRLQLAAEAELEGTTGYLVMEDIEASTPVPV